VALLAGEKVTHVFSPQEGIVRDPTSAGRLLITTNHRIISFSDGARGHETLLVPIEELKGVMLKTGARNSASLSQGLLMILGGLVVYFVLSYWLTGRFDGPSIPLINIDLGPFIILLALLGCAWFGGQHYFAKQEGSVTFQGSNWVFTFPYSGEKASGEVHRIVETVFAARNSRNGYFPLRQGP
jgi:hypothetical protein